MKMLIHLKLEQLYKLPPHKKHQLFVFRIVKKIYENHLWNLQKLTRNEFFY